MLHFTEELVQQIHDAPRRVVLAATGGGSRAIAELLDVPGGSRTLLEAVVPYSPQSMVEWLRGEPDEFCSAATARAMAMVAFHRARHLETSGVLPAGVACTAALATDRPRRGPHRIHIAIQTDAATTAWHLPLEKDRRSRMEEERLAGRLLLNAVAEACDAAGRLSLDLLENEGVQVTRVEATPAWRDLLLGNIECVEARGTGNGGPGMRDGGRRETAETPRSTARPVLSGAFNPLHDGHRRMIRTAQDVLGRPAAAELSILNADKPPLDYVEIDRRLRQFPAEQTVYLTRAGTFEEKSRLLPGATFLVGVDTLERIASPRYYGGDSAACRAAFERIASRGCRFLAFGRRAGDRFIRLDDLDIPDSLRQLCREVPPEIFREDVSSRAIRMATVPFVD